MPVLRPSKNCSGAATLLEPGLTSRVRVGRTSREARLEGQNYTQSFHERPFTHTSRARPILHDIVAFSNGDGGTIYVGANPDKSVPIHGIERPDEAIRMLKDDLKRTIEPPVEPEFVARGTQERGIITITVPKGDDAPYAFTPTGQVYIRLDAKVWSPTGTRS